MYTDDAPTFVDSDKNVPREDLPFVERDAVTVVLRNPRTGEYLGLKWLQVDWDTFVTGGIENGQTALEAALAEVREETGYRNVRFVADLPPYHSKFYHHPKKENRFAHFVCFLLELVDEEQDPISEDEQMKHTVIWLSPEQLKDFRLHEGHRYVMNYVLEKGL